MIVFFFFTFFFFVSRDVIVTISLHVPAVNSRLNFLRVRFPNTFPKYFRHGVVIRAVVSDARRPRRNSGLATCVPDPRAFELGRRVPSARRLIRSRTAREEGLTAKAKPGPARARRVSRWKGLKLVRYYITVRV